jgi:nucleoside diphosphate kinase
VVRDSGVRDRVKGTAGTIRGDHALDIVYGVVRGSEAPESASGKIKIFFPELG